MWARSWGWKTRPLPSNLYRVIAGPSWSSVKPSLLSSFTFIWWQQVSYSTSGTVLNPYKGMNCSPRPVPGAESHLLCQGHGEWWQSGLGGCGSMATQETQGSNQVPPREEVFWNFNNWYGITWDIIISHIIHIGYCFSLPTCYNKGMMLVYMLLLLASDTRKMYPGGSWYYSSSSEMYILCGQGGPILPLASKIPPQPPHMGPNQNQWLQLKAEEKASSCQVSGIPRPCVGRSTLPEASCPIRTHFLRDVWVSLKSSRR